MYSICILFYNEYPTIVNFALRVNKFMGEVLGGNYEIILIHTDYKFLELFRVSRNVK